MGNVGEEELVQMVRDYIESADASSSSSKPSSLRHQSTHHTLQVVIGKQTDYEVEIYEKISMYLNSNIGESTSTRNQKKWLVMKLKMDGYEASLCKTSWDSTFSRSKVFQFTENYEYIEVLKMDKTRLIVDVDFRSQFEVARPTRAFKELIDTLPSIFVGTEQKLKEIISLICPAGRKSLKEKGLHVPPWRSASYMQSKWLSTNRKKVTFSSNNELGMDQSEEKSTSTYYPFIYI